jgi:uncharacterized protein involved in outer membrane biogenesis
MKKAILIVLGVLVLLLAALAAAPYLFRDKIRQLVDQTLAESLDARVYYDPGQFGLSFFSHFPNPAVRIGNFGIVGLGPFDGDTLLSAQKLDLSLKLFSLLSDPVVVRSVHLQNPSIRVLVLEDGTANYLIAKSEEVHEAESSQEGGLQIRVDRWEIAGGRFVYDDQSLATYIELKDIEHSGSGNFSLDVFDLKTRTVAGSALYRYEGVSWLSGQRVDADITLLMDLNTWTFTFKNSRLQVNDLPVVVDGYFQMPEEGYRFDLRFAATDATVKSLYSLIPAVYSSGYEEIRAEGDLEFEGSVQGLYTETSMPAYRIRLKTDQGYLQYPGLSSPISDIRLDMALESATGNYEDISIDVPSFHFELGANPVDGRLKIGNLRDYNLQAELKARLNLADMMTIFPMDDLSMRGSFEIDLVAEGIYDSAAGTIPKFEAAMSMRDGYLKSVDLPRVVEDISFEARADCSTGRMQDVRIDVPVGRLVVDQESFEMNLNLRNLEDYEWDLGVKGVLELDLLRQLYPVDGMEYEGRLQADVRTSGRYSDVLAGRYERFPTSGNVQLADFEYRSTDLPVAVRIGSARATFTPDLLVLEQVQGRAGQSDFNISGQLGNYVRYFFLENEPLKGKISLASRLLDLNEWMSGEPTPSDQEEIASDSLPLEPIVIPRALDLEIDAATDRILYDNLALADGRGKVVIRGGMLDLQDFSFSLFGGRIAMNGLYDTRQPEAPLFNYRLNIQALSIPAAFTSFTAVRAFAPVAAQMNGDFYSEFSLGGQLDKNMKPVLNSLNGGGLIRIADALIKESKLVSGLMGFASPGASAASLQLKDMLLTAGIADGRASLRPFDLRLGKYTANLSGSIGVDGSIDYLVKTDIEAKQAGEQVSRLLANLQGNPDAKSFLSFNVTGTYRNPSLSPFLVNEKGETITAEGVAKTQAQAIGEKLQDKLGNEAGRLLGSDGADSAGIAGSSPADSAQSLPQPVQEQVEKAKEGIKRSLRDLLDRKKN